MFNSPKAFQYGFIAVNQLSDERKGIYLARKQQYRERFKWSLDLEVLWDNCLVHTSCNVPGKIGYFASVENMCENKVTRTSPEMFLSRYLANAPEHVRLAWETEVMGKILPVIEFVPNTNKERWIYIYRNGPQSCMKHSSLVGCYAHPENNLALAYSRTPEGKVTTRTIVNQKSKTYVRIYGMDVDLFAASLKKLGYGHDSEEALLGEKIYVEFHSCPSCDDDVVAGPFIDCEGSGVSLDKEGKEEGTIEEDGTKLIYSTDDNGDYPCEDCAS